MNKLKDTHKLAEQNRCSNEESFGNKKYEKN